MPLNPQDYMINIDPRQSVMGGIQQGMQLASSIEQMKSLKLQRKKAQDFQTDMHNLIDNPNLGAEDYSKMMIKYPEYASSFKNSYDLLSEQQKKAAIADATQLYAALDSENKDLAKDLIQKNLTAAENANDEKNIAINQTMMRMIDTDMNAAKTTAGLFLSSSLGDKDFSNVMNKLQDLKQKRAESPLNIKKLTKETELKEAEVKKVIKQTEKLDKETQKATVELENEKKKANGEVPPDKRFTYEEKLRKEYQNRTKNYEAAVDAFNKIEISAKDNTGAGDVALITSFMKMLDPGSVVRETEFATAQNTAGLYTALESALKKAETGEFLTTQQRKTFSNLAKKYKQAADKQEKGVRDDLTIVVDNYKLNKDNVFGNMAKQQDEKTTKGQFSIKEGTIIQNKQGDKMIMRGGSWQPM